MAHTHYMFYLHADFRAVLFFLLICRCFTQQGIAAAGACILFRLYDRRKRRFHSSEEYYGRALLPLASFYNKERRSAFTSLDVSNLVCIVPYNFHVWVAELGTSEQLFSTLGSWPTREITLTAVLFFQKGGKKLHSREK